MLSITSGAGSQPCSNADLSTDQAEGRRKFPHSSKDPSQSSWLLFKIPFTQLFQTLQL